MQISGSIETVSAEVVDPSLSSQNERAIEPSGMQIDLAAEFDIVSRQPQEPCQSSRATATDLSAIQTAAMLVASSNPMTPVGQRINARQATASRVAFDDPLEDEIEISHKQPLPSELQVAPTLSSPLDVSELDKNISAAPENP